MKKLNEDQSDLIREVLDHPGWKVFLLEVSNIVEGFEKRVLNYDLENRDDRGLSLEKAKTDGARKLQGELFKLKDKYFMRDKKG